MFTRVLFLVSAFCALVCAPVSAAIILTEDTTLGPDAVPTVYFVRGGTTTVLPGAPVRGITIDTPGAHAILLGDDGSGLNSFSAVGGGSVEVFGGTYIRSRVTDTGSMGVIHGGMFNEKILIEGKVDVTINGGEFQRRVGSYDFNGPIPGGTLTVNGGVFHDSIGPGINQGWTVNLYGGTGIGNGGAVGNTVNVYGYALERYDVSHGTWTSHYLQGFLSDGTPYGAAVDSRNGPAMWVIHSLGDTVPGDTNSDDRIDISDLNNVRNNFGNLSSEGDADFDGDVDIADLNLVRNRFGNSVDRPHGNSPVPEPATMALLLGSLALAGTPSLHRYWLLRPRSP